MLIAVEVVDLVMADAPDCCLMVESLIVFVVVGKHAHPPAHLILRNFSRHETGEQILHFLLAFRRVENRRLIHVVPESLDSLVCKETVLVAEPSAGVGI